MNPAHHDIAHLTAVISPVAVRVCCHVQTGAVDVQRDSGIGLGRATEGKGFGVGDDAVRGHGVDGDRTHHLLADGVRSGGKRAGAAAGGGAGVAAFGAAGLVPGTEADGIAERAVVARIGLEVNAVVAVRADQQGVGVADAAGRCPGAAAVGAVVERAVGVDASDGHAFDGAGVDVALTAHQGADQGSHGPGGHGGVLRHSAQGQGGRGQHGRVVRASDGDGHGLLRAIGRHGVEAVGVGLVLVEGVVRRVHGVGPHARAAQAEASITVVARSVGLRLEGFSAVHIADAQRAARALFGIGFCQAGGAAAGDDRSVVAGGDADGGGHGVGVQCAIVGHIAHGARGGVGVVRGVAVGHGPQGRLPLGQRGTGTCRAECHHAIGITAGDVAHAAIGDQAQHILVGHIAVRDGDSGCGQGEVVHVRHGEGGVDGRGAGVFGISQRGVVGQRGRVVDAAHTQVDDERVRRHGLARQVVLGHVHRRARGGGGVGVVGHMQVQCRHWAVEMLGRHKADFIAGVQVKGGFGHGGVAVEIGGQIGPCALPLGTPLPHALCGRGQVPADGHAMDGGIGVGILHVGAAQQLRHLHGEGLVLVRAHHHRIAGHRAVIGRIDHRLQLRQSGRTAAVVGAVAQGGPHRAQVVLGHAVQAQRRQLAGQVVQQLGVGGQRRLQAQAIVQRGHIHDGLHHIGQGLHLAGAVHIRSGFLVNQVAQQAGF